MISPEDFRNWQTDEVTKAVFEAIKRECYEMSYELAHKAGVDPSQDRYETGVIRGMERILEVDFEEASAEDA